MIRGGVILVTAAFTVIFLKKRLYIHNYVGCAFVIVGITVVGSAKFIFGKPDPNDKDSNMGTVAIILLLVSLITNGVLFVSEEKLFG